MSEKDIKTIQDRIVVLSHEKRVYEDEIFNGKRIPTWDELEHIKDIQRRLDNLDLALNLMRDKEPIPNWEEFISKLH